MGLINGMEIDGSGSGSLIKVLHKILYFLNMLSKSDMKKINVPNVKKTDKLFVGKGAFYVMEPDGSGSRSLFKDWSTGFCIVLNILSINYFDFY